MHSWFMWKLLGGKSCSEMNQPLSTPSLQWKTEALELSFAGKNGRWRERGRSHSQGGSARRVWSACCRHSSSTAKSDTDGLFPSMPQDFKLYPGLTYNSPVHQLVVLREEPGPVEQKTSGSPTFDLTIVCGRGGGGGPLSKAWYLLIHFLSSLAGHRNLEAEWTVGKNRLVSRSMLCELEPWVRVRVFEQPGKISLGRHRNMDTSARHPDPRRVTASWPIEWPFIPLTAIPLHSLELSAAAPERRQSCWERVKGDQERKRQRESSFCMFYPDARQETVRCPQTHLGNIFYHFRPD